jgi:hypothetical protein
MRRLLYSGLVLLAAGAGFFWYVTGGHLRLHPSNCPRGHLQEPVTCQAKEESGWQNSGAYYFIAKGIPRQEFCRSFSDNTGRLDSEVGKSCKTWLKTGCEGFPGLRGWACFACDRAAINRNTHYYLMAAVSADCSRGLYFSGSKHKPVDFAKKL